jgi:hypothetical protein
MRPDPLTALRADFAQRQATCPAGLPFYPQIQRSLFRPRGALRHRICFRIVAAQRQLYF